MRYKIYTSDEGFGHLVRQRAILDQIRALEPDIAVTLQTKHHLPAARRIFGEIDFVDRYNNITWAKTSEGTPDLEAIRTQFADYIERSDAFMAADEGLERHDFVISDFVYEAFEIADRADVPAFGVAHFTWDWFFSKLYPLPVRTLVLERLFRQAQAAKCLFFPPLTPPDILNAYGGLVKNVPLIVRQRTNPVTLNGSDKFKVLIIDSGTKLLSNSLKRALQDLEQLPDIQFYMSAYFGIEGENVTQIAEDEVMLDYIPAMDLVVCRAGFNTISECIAHRTPLLLFGEALNPEMESNLLLMKNLGVASFVGMDKLVSEFEKTLTRFIEGEYDHVKRHMDEHDLASDGARVIAEDILNEVRR